MSKGLTVTAKVRPFFARTTSWACATTRHTPATTSSTASIEITVRVTGTGEITNTASVASNLPEPETDPILGANPPDDNTDSATTNVASGKATAAVREGAEGTPVRYEIQAN